MISADVDMSGRTVLVTGATDGLGRVLARRLAFAGARVLIHGRDATRLRTTEAEIRRAHGSSSLRLLQADFASLPEVQRLAEEVRAGEERLDVLVSNAGIGAGLPGGGERGESADGLELRLAVNYLAGYLLSSGLINLLAASAPARIVNVASAAQMPIDFGDVMLRRTYSGVQAYSQSKLAQIMHVIDLADRWDPARVSANALHPATFMPTKMVPAAWAGGLSALEEGVEATLRVAVDPELEGVSGRYFNGLHEERAHPQAYDREARSQLRELSDQLVAEILAPR